MRRFIARTVAVAVVAMVAVAASQASRLVSSSSKPAAGKARAGHAIGASKQMKFIMIAHAPSTENFWITVYTGLLQAGKDLGVSVTFRGTPSDLNDPNYQRQLIQNAIAAHPDGIIVTRSEEHTSELQSPCNLVCRLLLEK